MQNRMIRALPITAVLLFSATVYGAPPRTAIEEVRDFYRAYLGDGHRQATAALPSMAMSKSFGKAVRKNAKICANYSTGVCGWAADGDEYLDAQETDPELTYVNSGIKLDALRPDVVQVKLNVYPSMKDANGYYDRTITYKMVKEGGRWVMDDILYSDGVSVRKKMGDENAYAIAHPDPDSPVGRRRNKGKK